MRGYHYQPQPQQAIASPSSSSSSSRRVEFEGPGSRYVGGTSSYMPVHPQPMTTLPYQQHDNGPYGGGHHRHQNHHQHHSTGHRQGPSSSHSIGLDAGYTSTSSPHNMYDAADYYGRPSGVLNAAQSSASAGLALPPFQQQQQQHGPSTISSSASTSKVQQQQQQQKVKRAKSAQKITRNRKITSCLQCRERKQKCDRQRPICSNCLSGNSRGGMCTYVDTPEGVQEVLANEEERDAKRMKHSPAEGEDDEDLGDNATASPVVPNPPILGGGGQSNAQLGRVRTTSVSSTRPMLPSQSPLTVRRINLIAATERAGKDKSLEFEARVRYARAAAMGSILFGTPPPTYNAIHQLYHPLAAVDSLKLPTANEMGAYLDTYRRYVEWMCNVVLVDLNRARFESFLNWWHSNPQTLPADPPLVPLVLTVLALALQAKRMAPHCSLPIAEKRTTSAGGSGRGRGSSSLSVRQNRGQSPREPFLATISSERELLETAQRSIDALQIVCPSNSASAFSAPLDLVRASLLRGIWHMNELHLQFAGSCFATTVRLAHAASLHHDTRHWPTMGKEEAQARRNIFWNVAMFESSFALRVTQPTIMLPVSVSDTHFPEDYDALLNLYRYGGLIEPYITEGRRSHFRVRPVTKASFDFHLARFQLTALLMGCQEMLKAGKQADVADKLQLWRDGLSDDIRHYLDDNEKGESKFVDDRRLRDDTDAETHYLQGCMLRMMDLSTTIQIHRPQADENGRWRASEGQAQQSLEVCINGARSLIRLIHSMLSREPGPPFVLLHQCIFQCFQAAIVIAIQSALSAGSNTAFSSPSFAAKAKPSLNMALQILDTVAEQDALRNVAEQAGRYAATLRDIDASQQAKLLGRSTASAFKTSGTQSREDTVEADLSASQNTHRSGVGVPAVIIAEGDGKILGGQGYPLESKQRAKSTSSSSAVGKGTESPARSGAWAGNTALMDFGGGGDAAGVDTTLNRLPSMQTATSQQYSFGIDFSDLQVFGHPDPAQAQRMGLAALDGTFNDRPVPIPEGPTLTNGNKSLSDILASSDWQAGQTDAAATTSATGNWPSGTPLMAGAPDENGFAQQEQQQQQQEQQQQDGMAQPLGDTFAMDWNEWERAVERLLHSER